MGQRGAGRSSVPAAVARHLRQEAGFGCCVCGLPIYRYHHIIPYREEPHFRPEDMVLLCPNHHAEADSRAMSEEQQRAYKQAPRNIEEGVSKGLVTYEDSGLRLREDDFVHVRGTAAGKVEGENAFGATLTVPGRHSRLDPRSRCYGPA